MEVSGVVLQQIPRLSGAVAVSCTSRRRSVPDFPGNLRTVGFQPRKSCGIMCDGFVDKGHLSYYLKPIRCGAKKEKVNVVEKEKTAIKKRMKLLKGLSKNLTMFSSMGFGLDPESGLVGEVQNQTISEATEILLKQLEQLKAEEKRLKKKRKEEKAKSKTMKMMNTVMESESSSSSSSESSDSDCGGEVVDMSCFRNKTEPFVESLQPAVEQTAGAVAVLPSAGNARETQDCLVSKNLEEGCSSRMASNGEVVLQRMVAAVPLLQPIVSPRAIEDCLVAGTTEGGPSSINLKKEEPVVAVAEPCLSTVEVCMGGKCKKSGGAALLGEFEKVMMGMKGSVVACKCMGKCRDGPNIRILNQSSDLSDSMRTPSNTICVGVGLQDVKAIVSSFFVEERGREGLDYVQY